VFDVNKLLDIATNENLTSYERLEAKRILRANGYSEILDKRVAEHITGLKDQLRAELLARDPTNGEANFDMAALAIGEALSEFKDLLGTPY